MYTYKISTSNPDYEKYNGKFCWIPRALPRHDGYIEVYVLDYNELILVRPSELED